MIALGESLAPKRDLRGVLSTTTCLQGDMRDLLERFIYKVRLIQVDAVVI